MAFIRENKEANSFYEGFPMGNGRLGATAFGGVEEETIVLNESSMWSGSFEDSDRTDAHKYLPEIRSLLAQGQVREAEKVFAANFTCKGKGSGYGNGAQVPFGCYQTLGKLHINFFETTPFRINGIERLHEYNRELHLDKAETTVYFRSGERAYTREYFVSAPDEVIAIRFTANNSGEMSMVIALDRVENSESTNLTSDSIVMQGTLPDGKGGNGVSYACIAKAVVKAGKVFTKQGKLFVDSADEVILLITAQTDLKGIVGRGNTDALKAAEADMYTASCKSWEELKKSHEDYFTSLYNRSGFDLEHDNSHKLTLKELHKMSVQQKGSTEFDSIYYAFAKYLFISASRSGEIPANLQGIWAEEIHTPWNADWHFNAQQMLYWPAEVWNLSSLHEPYLQLISALKKPGEKTAKAYYDAGGWVVHTFTNPWGFTSPGEDAAWGSTTGSAAWLCQHLWDHYLYTQDKSYLEEIYPVMLGAGEFYMDMLVEEPVKGYLVTSPSDSPENRYFTQGGDNCALCMGPTYDNQLVRYLFGALLEAGTVLGKKDELLLRVKESIRRLPPTKIGSDGRIMEWLEEYEEPLPYHRHVSHLWGVFPGNEITLDKTPELAKAALKSLKARGDASAEWAIAYRACLYARLKEPELAYDAMEKVLLSCTFPNLLCKCHHAPENQQPAHLPDYNDYHFPYQMDGNMGLLAFYAEALLQSFVEWEGSSPKYFIDILPSLPKKWKTGNANGLRARGGFEVDIQWKEYRIEKLQIRGKGKVKISCNNKCKLIDLNDGAAMITGEEIDVWN